jgi:hypothetical protein
MTTPSLDDVPIRTAEELTARWEAMLEPPVFGARALWMTWLADDGRMLKVVVPVDDIPLVPDRGMLEGLLRLHDAVAAEHLAGEGHLAMALCRPGRPSMTEDDEEWAEALHALLDDGQIDGSWSLHLAAGGTVQPLTGFPS